MSVTDELVASNAQDAETFEKGDLPGTDEVMVIHGRDCGMLAFGNDDLHAKVQEDLGADDGGLDYLPFSDVEQSVRDDVAHLKHSPLIADEVVIRGFVDDQKSGRVSEVG